ncbi:hypothetical protein H0H87_006742 [Tephrocybe sp. NHM501043]|nr:hypothetical protein H0H87_006742 [Tephrocybe sp. NHM501043]
MDPTSREAKELETDIAYNGAISSRCFRSVMAARLLIFSCFLRAFLNCDKPVAPSTLKKSWVFVQVDPSLLAIDEEHSDLFMELTAILCTIQKPHALSELVAELLLICRSYVSLLDPGFSGILHCVVDEAQTAAEAFPRAFRDGTGSKDRPALRAMIFGWGNLRFLHFVITGTSVNHDYIMEALSSAMGKYDTFQDGITDTGSTADKDHKIINYLEKYLPQHYLRTESGKELLSRAIYWLYGRPRFVAAYVQFVMDHNFRSYHRLLTKYIRYITRFVPTDALAWEENEDPIGVTKYPLCPFDFARAEKMHYLLLDLVQKLTYERLMSGNLDFGLSMVLPEKNIKLVECGFARFQGTMMQDSNPVIDEPLVYLAAEFWINMQGRIWNSRHDVFAQAIGNHTLTANGLERYTALCLADAFKDYIPLSTFFTFANIGSFRGLSGRSARLVSCWYDTTNTFRFAPSSFPLESKIGPDGKTVLLGSMSPCHRIGYSPKDEGGDYDWLTLKDRAPFLFPHTNFGPDLLFRLHLEGSNPPQIITVALQVKLRSTTEDFPPSDILQAIRTCTPDFFWLNKNQKIFKNKTAAFNGDDIHTATIKALDDLPGRFFPQEPNYHSILRCLFVYPAVPNQSTCQRILQVATQSASDSHELSVLPVTSIQKLSDAVMKATGFHESRRLNARSAAKAAKRDTKSSPYPTLKAIQELTSTEIVPDLVLRDDDVSSLDPAGLLHQLRLHRRLDSIRHLRRGPIEYATPDGEFIDRKNATQLMDAVRAAARRYEMEESS